METLRRSSTLDLRFDAEKSSGTTTLHIERQDIPWRVIRGFPNSAGETLAHLNNISGGVLDTDDLHFRMRIGPGAKAQVTSTGATRVYRSRGENFCGRTSIEAKIHPGGYLEYVPDALIPYANSRYEQAVHVHLLPGASMLWWEVLAPGREASNEAFRYQQLKTSFTICSGSQPILEERWQLEPQVESMLSRVRFGQYRYLSSLYVCHSGWPQESWRKLEDELSQIAEELSMSKEVLWGVSSLVKDGLVIRGLARNGRLQSQGLTKLWRAAKLSVCGREAVLPRKIH